MFPDLNNSCKSRGYINLKNKAGGEEVEMTFRYYLKLFKGGFKLSFINTGIDKNIVIREDIGGDKDGWFKFS